MKQKAKLSTSMTLAQFDNGYWYTTELKEFAETIGIPSANKLRKDELEKAVKLFLKTDEIKSPTKRTISISGINQESQARYRLCVSGPRFWKTRKTDWSDSVTKMCT